MFSRPYSLLLLKSLTVPVMKIELKAVWMKDGPYSIGLGLLYDYMPVGGGGRCVSNNWRVGDIVCGRA